MLARIDTAEACRCTWRNRSLSATSQVSGNHRDEFAMSRYEVAAKTGKLIVLSWLGLLPECATLW